MPTILPAAYAQPQWQREYGKTRQNNVLETVKQHSSLICFAIFALSMASTSIGIAAHDTATATQTAVQPASGREESLTETAPDQTAPDDAKIQIFIDMTWL